MAPRERRRLTRGWLIAFGLPLAAATGLCLLMRPSVQALVAPAFGPWAGIPFGHHGCTLANGHLPASLGALALGVALLAGAWRVRGSGRRAVLLTFGAFWALVWEAAALLSVVNTLE